MILQIYAFRLYDHISVIKIALFIVIYKSSINLDTLEGKFIIFKALYHKDAPRRYLKAT